jgi:tape measure domain-containing protein
MTGINIPIGGDLAPFLAIAAELRNEMKQLSGSVRTAMRPAKGESANIAGAMKRVFQSSFSSIISLSRSAAKLAGAAFRSLLSVARGVWGGIKSGFASAASSVKRAFSSITSSIPGGGLLGPLVGIAGIAASVALVTSQLKGAFSAAAAFEDLEVSVSSFLGSTKDASELLGELQNFADKTPFATRDIQEAAGALLGAGVRGDVAGITKDIAAVAKNGQQLKELADALGKGFAKGKFQTEELNKFLERGINLMPALQQQTGLAGKELTKAIEAGLGFETVSAAIASMSREGGMFFGLLERRSQAFTGLASTLSSVWETVRRTFAQPILDAIKPILQDAIGLVGTFKATAEKAGKAIGDVLLSTFALIKGGKGLDVLKAGLKLGFTTAIDLLMRGLRSAVAFLAATLPPIFAMAMSKLTDPVFWQGLGLMVKGIGQSIGAEIRASLPGADTGAINAQRDRSDMLIRSGAARIEMAGDGQKIGDVLTDALLAGGIAAKEAFGGTGQAVKDAADDYKDLMETVRKETEELLRRAAVSGPKEGATGDANSGPLTNIGDTVKSAVGQAMTLTTSLGRVGGGGFGRTFLPMVNEAKKSNQLLATIARNTANMGLTPAIA